MKKIVVILSIIFVLGSVGQVQAHTFLTDGDITVLLHTNPDDDPIVGQPAAVLLQITDSTNKYASSKCDCAITISENNKVLFNGPLLYVVGASVYDLTAPFTFPERAVYQIEITGKPKVAGEFQSFNVKYDLRVDRGTNPETNTKSPLPKLWLILGGVVIIGVIIGLVIYFKSNKGNRK